MDKLLDHIEATSYQNIHDLVATQRDPQRDFSSFELFDPLMVQFEKHEPVQFFSGSRIAYYGRGAIYLACLNSPTHSIQVRLDGDVTIAERDLADPAVFNTWMNTLWSLTFHPDNRPRRR